MIIIIVVTVSIIELSTNLNKITSIKILPSTDLYISKLDVYNILFIA